METERLTGVASWVALFGAPRDELSPSEARKRSAGTSPPERNSAPDWHVLSLIAGPAHWAPQVADVPGCRAILDGVVYNRSELQAEFDLGASATTSDAEFAARAYRLRGETALHRIRGVFALIVWDRQRGRVVCMRDPLGIYPLFYAKTREALWIAPSIEVLLGQRPVSAAINRARLVEHLTRQWTGGEETCFEKILRLRPGHMLSVDQNGERVIRCWNPLPTDRPIAWIPDDEAEARLNALLGRAVERSLAQQPAAVLLSGGIDSSTVAMIATDLCRHAKSTPPWALSLMVPDPSDEEGRGRGIAEDLGMPQYCLSPEEAFGPGGPLAAALALTRVLPSPLYNVGQPAFLNLSRGASQRGCRSVLTGEGSDEWLGMSPLLAANMLTSTDFLAILRLGRALSQYYANVRWGSLNGVVWQYGMRPALRRVWHFAVSAADRIRGIQNERLANGATGTAVSRVGEAWIAPDPNLRQEISERIAAARDKGTPPQEIEQAYRRAVLAQLESPQPALRTEESFLVGQLSGVPQKDPFWDADLIELIVRIRPEVKNRGGVSKALLRNALASRFPTRGFASQRKGISRLIHIRSAMLAKAPAVARAMGNRWVLDELGIVDTRRAVEFVNHCPEDRAWRVWYLINLETWVRARTQSQFPAIV